MKSMVPARVAWLPVLMAVALLCSCGKNTTLPSKPEATSSGITIRVATYNVRNYNSIARRVDGAYKPDWPKPEVEKTALRTVIIAAHPDILALEEMGGQPQLDELRHDLSAAGLNYDYSFWVNGPDPDRHIALLSHIPFAHIQPHENVPFKLSGNTLQSPRGLLEVEFITNGQTWVLYAVHLKSRLTETADDPQSAAEREAEAKAVRDVIRKEQDLAKGTLVAVVGDFNDARDSAPLKRFLDLDGKPLFAIAPTADSHGETWTSSYGRADEYDRSDYILLSPTLLPLQKKPGGIADLPASLIASDHRLVWVDLQFPGASH